MRPVSDCSTICPHDNATTIDVSLLWLRLLRNDRIVALDVIFAAIWLVVGGECERTIWTVGHLA
jgi:hypothetical protein